MLLVGIGYLGKVIALPLWGRVAHYAGARRLLWIGGTSIVPVAALWLAADFFTPWQTTVVFPAGLASSGRCTSVGGNGLSRLAFSLSRASSGPLMNWRCC